MTQTAPQKFGFDTWFDEDGRVVSSTPIERRRHAYSPAEVEAIRAQAFAEGQADQRSRDEGETARSLSEISQACSQAFAVLDGVVARYRVGAADLAHATGEAIATGALERFPQAPLATALEALSEEVTGTARLVIRTMVTSPQIATAIETAAQEAGFAGRILLRDEPQGSPAAFIIEWPDGRAEFEPAAAAERVREALQTALAAEADGGVDLLNGDQ